MEHALSQRALAHFDELFPQESSDAKSLNRTPMSRAKSVENGLASRPRKQHVRNVENASTARAVSSSTIWPANQDSIAQSLVSISGSERYPENRYHAFEDIVERTQTWTRFRNEQCCILEADCLEVLRAMPTRSVDLILTDPPYHSTKKENIRGDSDFSHDLHYRRWIKELGAEWKRILRPNGSLYMFCSSEMAPFLYVDMSEMMNMHNLLTWTKPNEPGYDGWKQKMKKESLRRWYPHSERIIFCSPADETTLKRSPFGAFLRRTRRACGLSSNELTEVIGAYGRVNNGGAVSNWETGRNIPNREQYSKICDAFLKTGKVSSMPAYEDVIRPFEVNGKSTFVDVWDFVNVRQYKGKYPAEKPVDLLEHIVRSSSYPEGVVLDCFSGSGATGVAALRTGRRFLGIEIDPHWVEYSVARIEKLPANTAPTEVIKATVNRLDRLPLFSV